METQSLSSCQDPLVDRRRGACALDRRTAAVFQSLRSASPSSGEDVVGKVFPARMDTRPLESISVVLPAFNEEARVKRSIDEIASYLDAIGVEYEMIVVNDGSIDS